MLVFLQIAIVGNLQVLPACAMYGLSLPFLYALAIVGFFIPCLLMIAELSTCWPQTGGAYIWVEQAFGKPVGFFVVTLQWISNLVWYPSIFTLIATSFAYAIFPNLANNKYFIMLMALGIFWTITVLNCMGVRISTRISVLFCVLGIIFPVVLVVVGGVVWWLMGQPIHLSTTLTPWIPPLNNLSQLSYLIAIVISLLGMEVTSTHAGNVINPKRDYVRSLAISGVSVVVLMLSTEIAIAAIVPNEQLSVVSGLLDALMLFFTSLHLNFILKPIFLLIFLGNLGSVCAWMMGSTRCMFVACEHNRLPQFLSKTNRNEAPVGVLILEAFIFTAVIGVFLLFPRLSDTSWLLLDLASQINLLYYVVLFIAAMCLRTEKTGAPGFIVPGGKLFFWFLMTLGASVAAISLSLGFIATPDLSHHEVLLFHRVMVTGLAFVLVVPWVLLGMKVNE